MGLFDKLTSKAKELADSANLDKLTDKAKNFVGEENLGKLANTAKGLTETAKAKIHEATAPLAPPELTERQSELVENFGYTVKGGEIIIFASDDEELMLTSRAVLYAGLRTAPEIVLYEEMETITIYFATDWRYVRIFVNADEFHLFDNIELSDDEAMAFCQAMIDAFGFVGEDGTACEVRDGSYFINMGEGWELTYEPDLVETYLDIYSQECGFKLAPGEKPVFAGGSFVGFLLTNKNLLIDMSYHPAYEGKNRRVVMGFENSPLTIQIEPGNMPVHIITDSGIADQMNLFPTEVGDMLDALDRAMSGPNVGGGYNARVFTKIAIEIIYNPDGTNTSKKYENAEEPFFSHPNAEAFHKNNQPPLGMVFALKAEDGFFYPAEAGKPDEDGMVDVEFLSGQTARLKMKYIVDCDTVYGSFCFQANWESRGQYYPCNLTILDEDCTEFSAEYVDDGIVEQVNIRRIRAYQ